LRGKDLNLRPSGYEFDKSTYDDLRPNPLTLPLTE
jgi:hypothetical protein